MTMESGCRVFRRYNLHITYILFYYVNISCVLKMIPTWQNTKASLLNYDPHWHHQVCFILFPRVLCSFHLTYVVRMEYVCCMYICCDMWGSNIAIVRQIVFLYKVCTYVVCARALACVRRIAVGYLLMRGHISVSGKWCVRVCARACMY